MSATSEATTSFVVGRAGGPRGDHVAADPGLVLAHVGEQIAAVDVTDGVQPAVDGDRIGYDASGAKMVVVLPGLTDAHVHLGGRSALERLVRFGVTTALDMSNAPPEFVDSMRGIRGLTDIRSAGTARMLPMAPVDSAIPA